MIQISSCLILLWGLSLSLQSGAEEPPIQVVYHIATDEVHRQQIALLNLENHLMDLAEQKRQATIKVLLEGGGVSLLSRALRDPRLQQRMISLHRKGVELLLGRDSVERQGLELERDLFRGTVDEVVENSILTLVALQQQGFAYIPYVTR